MTLPDYVMNSKFNVTLYFSEECGHYLIYVITFKFMYVFSGNFNEA